MNVYLQGLSALSYYRNGGSATEIERCPSTIRALVDCTSSRAAIANAGVWRIGIGEPSEDRPLEVLVRDAKQRARSRAVHARVWRGFIAPTAFRTARKDIYVSSPEFLFLQMATRLDLPELVALGMELCGTYRRNVELPHVGTDGTSFVTIYQQPPLSTSKRLQGFISTMQTAPGHARANRALQYILDGSASPMETVLYLLLCFPRRMGGYALPKPVLNPAMVISRSGQRHTLRKSAKPDLYWKTARLDLEYNSDEFHEENQRAIDSMRRKALERMKVEVIELTPDELLSVSLFHATALRIARRLGKRVRAEHEGDFINKRRLLRDALLAEDASASSQPDSSDDNNPYDGSDWVHSENPIMSDNSDIWLNQLPDEGMWPVEVWDGDDTWTAELSDWEDEGIYVFGAGKRKAD